MAELHRWERLAARGKAAAGPLVVFVVIVGLWEATVRLLAIPQYMLPAPSAIAMSFEGNMSELIANGWATLWAALLGYLLGNGFALVMAGLMAEFAPVERALYPWMLALRAVPSVALAPLLLIWIGFNIWPIVITAALICFFPTLVNAIDGFKATDAVTLELMRGLNASRWSVFWRVKLRYSLPNLFSAFKISVASALIGAVVGEWISSEKGLGYMTVVASKYVDTLMLFRAIIGVTVIALVWFFVTIMIERRALRWRQVGR
ncbi:hypothetical protein A5746_12850 [Mycolicibacterium conceptionense]|uniref:ABC transporter permease n=1 Tax=Mycolicibacterium conceptionense TaxID=451644 RepID=UPI0007EC8557|nr:ABC transporter permease [Mycolicibacterium conceptionense]OBJ95869.1 hypothetical protein A5639_03375 [Mycolicibacterium conceptionense]OMB71784.1 hypothetical protein A5741_06865 [Mycolicibacterium conceptionense]OMC00068.1 hypothetical protein A5746_12850 [Mycolicibacterium conceptionense]